MGLFSKKPKITNKEVDEVMAVGQFEELEEFESPMVEKLRARAGEIKALPRLVIEAKQMSEAKIMEVKARMEELGNIRWTKQNFRINCVEHMVEAVEHVGIEGDEAIRGYINKNLEAEGLSVRVDPEDWEEIKSIYKASVALRPRHMVAGKAEGSAENRESVYKELATKLMSQREIGARGEDRLVKKIGERKIEIGGKQVVEKYVLDASEIAAEEAGRAAEQARREWKQLDQKEKQLDHKEKH
jgi:hypothetical protein